MALGSAMVTNVGYKLNQTLSTTTKPTILQVTQWLNDGQNEFIRQLHPLLMPGLVVSHTPGVKNGTFDSDTLWTKSDAALTISSGKANWSGAQSSNADLSQDAGFTIGTTYEVSFVLSGRTAGSVTVLVGTATGTSRSSDDTYAESIECTGNTNLVFRGDSTFDGSVDTVTITAQATTIKTALPSDYFKQHKAYDSTDGEPLKLIGYDEFVEIKSGANSYLSTSSYVFTVGNDGATNCFFYYVASDPSAKTFVYIKKPTTLANSTEVFSLADEFIPVVVDYAVMQHQLQDEEIQTQQAMLKNWTDRIDRINQRIV